MHWKFKRERERERAGTCLTDSAISGPMPSPGKRVAWMGAVAEEKALGKESGEIGLAWERI